MGLRNTFFSSHKKGKRRGVAIWISNAAKFELISQINDREGTFVLVKGKIDQKEVTLFNILLNPSLDTNNRIRRRNLIEKRINKVLKDLGLIDVWRALNGSTPGYTFYSGRHTAYSRIDYFFKSITKICIGSS